MPWAAPATSPSWATGTATAPRRRRCTGRPRERPSCSAPGPNPAALCRPTGRGATVVAEWRRWPPMAKAATGCRSPHTRTREMSPETKRDYATTMTDDIRWMSTRETSERLGITLRTLYRFIDEGQLPAYKFGRVIRLKEADVEEFIDGARIEPGALEHLYPEPKKEAAR
ncbi:MAG: hypothetical protein CYG61_03625 [Actinobacteria bacterium]|nr:MAG: hypothetical protein CYG61_03625 [Actinomycetota bacterium]